MTVIGTGQLPPTVLYTNMVEKSVMSIFNGLEVASGSLTADTYPGSPQIDLTGPGTINWLSFYVADTTSRTVTIKVLIDGTEIIEDSLAAITTANSGGILIGIHGLSGSNYSLGGMDQIPFDSSCQVYLKSSVTETDKCTLTYIARTS